MRLTSLHSGPWYRVAPSLIADPFHIPSISSTSRFNDGISGYRLLYFAPNIVTALFEARAMLGQLYGHFAPAGVHRSWTFYCYDIVFPGNPKPIIDFGDPINRHTYNTTIQEMTGDWEGYHLRRLLPFNATYSNRIHAPTQELGANLANTPHLGLLAPSACNPLDKNLVLYYDRLPSHCVKFSGKGSIQF